MKPKVTTGSCASVGRAEIMAAAAALATRYDPELLCEAFIDGDEITEALGDVFEADEWNGIRIGPRRKFTLNRPQCLRHYPIPAVFRVAPIRK